jgi:hypothetical protein
MKKARLRRAFCLSELSILRLLGALGEREPPFGHFDEK